MIPTADTIEVELFPTAYFRYERRDLSCPTMVLQQWWCDKHSNLLLRLPEQCETGLWRDVPIVQEQPKAPYG